MIIQQKSVGEVPFFAIQATFAFVILMLAALWWHTHRNGPAIMVNGLKEHTTVPIHANDSRYAEAIAKRFVHEYLNWSYTGHLQAKSRAAYLCNAESGKVLLRDARANDHYLQQLLDTSNAAVTKTSIAWANEPHDHYLVKLEIAVDEWQSFAHTKYPVEAYVEVRPLMNQQEKQFRMEVVKFQFTQLSAAVTVQDDDEDAIDQLYREAREKRDESHSVPVPDAKTTTPPAASPGVKEKS